MQTMDAQFEFKNARVILIQDESSYDPYAGKPISPYQWTKKYDSIEIHLMDFKYNNSIDKILKCRIQDNLQDQRDRPDNGCVIRVYCHKRFGWILIQDRVINNRIALDVPRICVDGVIRNITGSAVKILFYEW